jgi:acyl carrier protein
MSAPTTTDPGTTDLMGQVRTALCKQFGAALEPVADNDLLREALGDRYDSLAALECICRIESEFGIEVDFVEHDVRHFFSTIELICEFVRDQLEDLAVLGASGTRPSPENG